MWSPPEGDSASQQKAVVAHLIRGAGLALGSVALGVFCSWSLPDMIMGSVVQGALPAWFYDAQWQIMTVGGALGGLIMNAGFR